MMDSDHSKGGEMILVTGGAGYVGSHTVVVLLEEGYNVVVIDNFSNGSKESLNRIEKLTGKTVTTYEVDVLNKSAMNEVFQKHKDISGVIHFAALKAVGESMSDPVGYFKVNVMGTVNLIEVMTENDVNKIIFSSSATVYGDPEYLPMDEKHPVGNCTSPYAKSKFCVEQFLSDYCYVKRDWSAIVLRYFNPVGAHKSGMIGEAPSGVPNNLTPYIAQVAVGIRKQLSIFGNDYETKDGTGVRDYVHVMDIARGHTAALRKTGTHKGCLIYNLGTGKGSSVLEVLAAFEKACDKTIKSQVKPRRGGDVAAMCADPTLAEKELNWGATMTLDEMCEDMWRWQRNNPTGYTTVNGSGPLHAD